MAQKMMRKKLSLWRLIFFFLCLAAFIAAGTGTYLVFASVRDMPAISQAALQTGAETMIYDINGKLVTQIGTKNSNPVDLKKVPDQVKNAFLAIEDPNFYQHHGFSVRGIVRAVWTDLSSGSKLEGGSTITQQLVRISFLSPDKTFKRKIQEIIMSVQMERRYTKDEILEMYLNNVYLGEGAYGIGAAARTYFGKDVLQLDLEEAALLGGLPQAPSAYSPFQNPQAALSRRNAVLDGMAKYNYISQSQAEKTKVKALKLDKVQVAGMKYPYPFFIDYVTDKLIEKYGEAEVFRKGLKVYTSLDPKIQQIAETAMTSNANFPSSRRDGNGVLQPEGAVVVLDPHTGYIEAMVGGREHTQKRQWNRATQTTRQPGSAFKPIIAYGPAIEYKGLGQDSVVDDAPVKYGSYEPRNFDGTFRGPITLRTALTNSINVVAVKLLMDTVGIDNAIKFASGLGIQLNPSNEGPSMALGGLHDGVTPLQMASAYGAFANQGIYIEPTVIRKVERTDGVILEQLVPKERQAMKATTAYSITDMLQSVMQSGTGTAAQIGRPAAGKTGTTDDGKDIWFVGYTPELVASVWIGYDKPTAMPQAFGGTYPAMIWQEIMSKALSNTPITTFSPPAGITTAKDDSKSGVLPGPNTSGETVPKQNDNKHSTVPLTSRESGAAQGQPPSDQVNPAIPGTIKLQPDIPNNATPLPGQGNNKKPGDANKN